MSLTVVNLSYNELGGQIPNIRASQEASFDAIRNNRGLCGNNTRLKACPKGKMDNKIVNLVVLPLLGSLLLSFLFVGGFFFLSRRIRNEKWKSEEARCDAIWSPYDRDIQYENIIEATEDFDSKHCIGVGGYGLPHLRELLLS
ncbi:conserved hypothetical protein [Ricinus communis]|uniref:non-specific serine/threonine protein kinase n=1 Tax=Ricinus communis TaxID=3988 RepID=B9SAG8_RICCO|nr:conserved hypothetical protein [Ricinus communis]